MSSGETQPCYMPYQIDFSARGTGKLIASTKRRICWRFGYPNRQAIEEGMTGVDCRGEEHQIIVVWSMASGKVQIRMDHSDILYSITGESIVDHTWAKDNHVLKVVCRANPSSKHHQYDLFVDGQSFFKLPKVFELGTSEGAMPSEGRRLLSSDAGETGGYQLAYSSPRRTGSPPPPEPVDETCQSAVPPTAADAVCQAAPVMDLLDFTTAPPPPVLPPATAPQLFVEQPAIAATGQQQPYAFLGLSASDAHNGGFQQPEISGQAQLSIRQYSNDGASAAGAAADVTNDPFAPKPPSHDSIVHGIMNAYGASFSPAALTVPTTPPEQPIEAGITSAILSTPNPTEEEGYATPADEFTGQEAASMPLPPVALDPLEGLTPPATPPPPVPVITTLPPQDAFPGSPTSVVHHENSGATELLFSPSMDAKPDVLFASEPPSHATSGAANGHGSSVGSPAPASAVHYCGEAPC